MRRTLAIPGENVALTYRHLRALIGWIGLSLPAVLFAAGIIDGHLESSLSTYYYTNVGTYFTGALCVIGVFLLAYRFGTFALEDLATTLAGLAALGVAFFHAAPPDPTAGQLRLATVHLTCAGILFVLLGAIAVFVFPSDVPPNKEWQARTYRTLGIVIWASILAMILLNRVIPVIYDRDRMFFWLESVCVIAFSTSFILKGHLRCPAGAGGTRSSAARSPGQRE
jgi:hypothetical protein